ncbi:DUF192 domain-containing protein [Sinorhizobium saheli]
MLLVFEDSRPRRFTLENPPIPLDLLFVGEDGKLRAIENRRPFYTCAFR